jgi:tetratricopeptide (TPR) repeat protein
MWNEHPGWMAFGMTTWGINRLAYGFGLWGYSNPYYVGGGDTVVYDYSQPIIEQPVYTDPGGGAAPTASYAPPPDSAMSTFDVARSDFYAGNYESALNNCNLALKDMPKDAVVHEFRSLVLFALGRYSEAAATIHPVLAVGPGWDWATLVGLYPTVDVYTAQLRKLEEYAKANPKAADAYFLMAYHYLTCDHKEAAHKTFEKVVSLQPKDAVAAEYVQMTTPEPSPDSPVPQPPAASVDIPADKLIADADVVGKWKANGGNGTAFALELTDKGEFTWTYTQGKNSQSVKGVYALDNNKLAMEPDSGGTMLADLSKKGAGFHFDMEGAPANDPGLDFVK